MPVEVGLMGGVVLVRDGRACSIGGPKQQLVLAVLALSAGAPVGIGRLVDLIWDDRPPRTARRTLQSYISSLRAALGPDAPLRAVPGGYRLDIARSQVDLLAFEDDVSATLANAATAPETTAEALAQALSTWSEPLELSERTPRVAALIVPFEELRLQAVETLVATQIDSGQAGKAVRRLEQLVRENPTRENLWLQLARGLSALGRRDAALSAMQRAREQLREHLGVEPSGRLQSYEHELLSDDLLALDDADDTVDGRPHAPESTATALPGGRVTFVFTDIEGSTKLLRALDDRYAAVLDDHRRIMRAAWAADGGHEVSTDGDACFVAFDDTTAAVRACLAAQDGLVAHRWPDDHPVRVRMGVHVGLAYPRDGDYVAFAVHQAARIADAANGQQVLISAEAAADVRPPLSERLRDLGRFRVRDFDAPVRLHGIDVGPSHTDHPAPRLTPADGHNLIAPPGAFFARAHELAQIPRLLDAKELVTISGPGGVGKTRLAIEVGLVVAPLFADGVWMAALDSIDDPELIGSVLAAAVGVVTSGRSDPWERVLDHLVSRRALVIIDNCEHLAPACAERAAELLQRCPDVTVLATSRAPLGLLGERVVRLDPLPSEVDGDGRSEAVQLFIARAARPPPTATTEAAQEIADLCREVDGLPLAIELVASRTDMLSPGDIRTALARRSSLLTTHDPRLPPRQRSLERLLDWSYQLLTTDEQVALRRLTVFADGFDLTTAATAIADDGGDHGQTDELVWSLASKSLVVLEPAAGTTRYRLLRTVRTHAATHLDDAERVDAARRLAELFAGEVGPDVALDRAWVGDMALEVNNVRSLVTVDGIDERLRQKLAWSLGRYHDLTDEFATGIAEATRHLALLPGATPERVALLTMLADLRLRVGDLGGSSTAVDEASTLLAQVGAPSWDDAGVQRTLGDLAMRAGRHDEAREIIGTALSGDLTLRGQGRLLDLLGLLLADIGDYDGSDAALRRELIVWSKLGDDSYVATTRGNLAETALRRDRFDEAARHQLECLDLARSLGQPVLVAFSMIMAAQLALRQECWRDAIELQFAADAMLSDVGYVLFDTDERARRELLDTAMGHLGLVADLERSVPAMELETAIEKSGRTLESVV